MLLTKYLPGAAAQGKLTHVQPQEIGLVFFFCCKKLTDSSNVMKPFLMLFSASTYRNFLSHP